MRTPGLAGLVLAVLIASPVIAMTDRVIMRDGSSYDVRGFEITDNVVNMVALNGRSWSVWSELVDLEATRRANHMSPGGHLSPSWGGGQETMEKPLGTERLEPVIIEPEPPAEPLPVERLPDEPMMPEAPVQPESVALEEEEEETLEEPAAEPVTEPSMLQAEEGAEGSGRKHFQLLFNASYHATTIDFSQSRTFDLYLEEGTLDSEYSGGTGPTFEVGGTYLLTESVGVGGSFELFDRKNEGSFEAALPHPFFFDQPRELSGELSDLSYRETAVHIFARFSKAAAPWLVFEGFGGPTVFFTRTDVLAEVIYAEEYPFDEVSFEETETETLEDNPFGFNVGGGVLFVLSPEFGFAVQARFSRARVSLASDEGESVEFDAGGFRAGVGFRVLF
ncbi:MAG TPA: hypothetical protein VLK65_21300 [Vicinamibacteria bacterium]|nr:hypothetical protein [Vicinamibacteria bacterium]